MQRPNPLTAVFPFRTFAVIVVVVLAVLFAFALGNLILTGEQLNRQAATLRAEIAREEAKYQRLQARRDELLNNDAVIEALAREQLGWIRPGDTAIVVVPVGTPPPRREPPPPARPPDPNWVKWVSFLLGKGA